MTRQLRCRNCKTVFQMPEKEDTLLSCEDCGDHPANTCPECGESVDRILDMREGWE